jgi:hypothetical protein
MFEMTKLVDEPWEHEMGVATYGVCEYCNCSSAINGECQRIACPQYGFSPRIPPTKRSMGLPPPPYYRKSLEAEISDLHQQELDWWDEEFEMRCGFLPTGSNLTERLRCVKCGTYAEVGSNYCLPCYNNHVQRGNSYRYLKDAGLSTKRGGPR